MTLDGVNATA